MPIRSHRTVAGEVRSHLDRSVFTPATSRVLWLPVHLLLIVASTAGIVEVLQGNFSIFLLPLFSLLIGLSFGGLAFVGHETLHGATVRQRWLRNLVGFIGFSPFCISPALWVAWHNRIHHMNTNVAGKDPDAYPNLQEYRSDKHARWSVDWAAPRSGHFRGVLTLLIGFSLQSTHMLSVAKSRGYLSRKGQRLALAQSTLALAAWIAVGLLIGPIAFLFAYLLPLILANGIVMSFIITNHSLCPLTPRNDVLTNSLTVTVPTLVDFFTLGFGYHVEHHLFPSMSNRHGRKVSQVLTQLYPKRYQKMRFSKALYLLFKTPRIYRENTLLFDPDTGETWSTLGPDRRVKKLKDAGPRPPRLESSKASIPPPLHPA